MTRINRSAAKALLCTVALLLQATVLPLAHSRHDAAARGEQARTLRVDVAQGASVLHDAQAASDAHDAAACPLCATVAHGRVGLRPLGVAIAVVARPLWTVPSVQTAPADRPVLAAGGPRAPPFCSA